MNRRILLLYTGGTIGMTQQADGLAPTPGLEERIRELPELATAFREQAPEIDIISYDPLLDSSDMTPSLWLRIASDIEAQYAAYDGFVVLHGTDTMAHTASALSFFIRSRGKPVVLTGAQLPFSQPRSDARNNLVSALEVAARMPGELARVCVVFGSRILQGNRATKVSAQAYDAFDSPRFPRMGRIGIDVDYDPHLPPIDNAAPLQGNAEVPAEGSVALLKLFPGFSPGLIRSVCQSGSLRALVLEAYGAGNGPGRDTAFLQAVREAVEAGITVLIVPQPLDGIARMRDYAAGSALIEAGAISGRDMTTEAALAKLYYLIAHDRESASMRDLLHQPFAGEIMPRP